MAQLKVTQIKSKIGGNSARRNSLRSREKSAFLLSRIWEAERLSPPSNLE